MTSLQERLFAMQDKQYAAFQAKLTPGVPMESFIGIRVPVLRKFAKEFTKEKECEEFLHQLPHQYYDENMLHGLLISEVKDYEECIRLTDSFLPFVDNWAVCDIMSPKVFIKHKKELLAKIKTWSKSSHVYTCRFGIEALMSHYLDKDFKAEYTVKGLEDVQVKEGVLTYKTKGAETGRYTLKVSDKSGKYADLKTDFELTTEAVPVVFN